MAKKQKAKKTSKPKNDAVVTWKMEWFPASLSQNAMYSDQLLNILGKRVRRAPFVYSAYNHGKLVWIGSSPEGMSKHEIGMWKAQIKKHTFDRFSVYTLAKRKQANDLETLAWHIAFPGKSSGKNFARAKNLGDVARRDVKHWATTESRKIQRTLRPLERKYNKSVRRLEVKEHKLRKSYGKRIDKAKDKGRQKKFRAERDKKLKWVSMERKKLHPWRNSIAQWAAKWRTFQNLKV